MPVLLLSLVLWCHPEPWGSEQLQWFRQEWEAKARGHWGSLPAQVPLTARDNSRNFPRYCLILLPEQVTGPSQVALGKSSEPLGREWAIPGSMSWPV